MDVTTEDVTCGEGPVHHGAEKACHLAISLEQHFINKSRKKNSIGTISQEYYSAFQHDDRTYIGLGHGNFAKINRKNCAQKNDFFSKALGIFAQPTYVSRQVQKPG